MDTSITLSYKERHDLAERGIAVATLKAFMSEFRLTQKQMALLLGISDKTLFNLLKNDRMDLAASDRFLLVQAVFQEGIEALMSKNTFQQWLHKPHRYFEGKAPIAIMTTINGLEAVREELIRTKYGILS